MAGAKAAMAQGVQYEGVECGRIRRTMMRSLGDCFQNRLCACKNHGRHQRSGCPMCGALADHFLWDQGGTLRNHQHK